ncbi:hypothetical protein L7F22_009890 [Adiantum nelumboides]|nr:hypothetical protein [Adiantum nelumboides]
MAVLLSTSYGNFTIDLYTTECPIACTNFLKLCKLGYYNNCMFHAIIHDFIVHTGDPTGMGLGGDSLFKLLNDQQQEEDSKRFFSGELHPSLKHEFGIVAMANAGGQPPHLLNASQFYITLRHTPIDYLDGKHTIFGKVSENLDVLDKINNALVDQRSFRPLKNIGIKEVFVIDDPFEDPMGFSHLLLKGLPIPPQPSIQYDDDDAAKDANSAQSTDGNEESIRRREAHSRAVVLEMIGDIPEAEIKPPDNVLFICKLNPITEEDDLQIIFSQFGTVLSVDIIRNQKTGESLCYGFVEFDKKETCERAYFKMDNALIDDRRIHVDFSQSVGKIWARYRVQLSNNKHARKESKRKHQPTAYDGQYCCKENSKISKRRCKK